MEKEKKIALLLIRRLTGLLTKEQEAELEEWSNRIPDNRWLTEEWLHRGSIKKQIALRQQADEYCVRMERRIRKEAAARNRRIRMLWGVASCAVIVLSVAGWFNFRKELKLETGIIKISSRIPVLKLNDGHIFSLDSTLQLHQAQQIFVENIPGERLVFNQSGQSLPEDVEETVVYNTLIVPRGAEFNLCLEDGTQIWLNADSEIKFPVKFGQKERRVFIQGEAYFKVSRDTLRPFRVETSGLLTEVLGTEFNVQAYPEMEQTWVTLIEGEVKVVTADEEKFLIPGCQAQTDGKSILVRQVDTSPFTAWRSGLFSLEGKSLDEIMFFLSRWYDFTITYQDEELKQLMFDGQVPRYETIDRILEILERTKEVKFEIKNTTIKVKK